MPASVNKTLGIDMDTGKGNWPPGLQVHAAGLNETGDLVITEVWDTPEHQARFLEERLGTALEQAGIVEPPSSVTWIELVAHHRPGG
jgi:hypothetical protein